MEQKELNDLIEQGHMAIGDIVWICDYRYDNPMNKAIRHIVPQKVIIRKASDTSKTIYYSDFFFSPIGKSGKPVATVIAPYDNTGFRGWTGISLKIFRSENDCKAEYALQCEHIIEQLEKAKADSIALFDQRITTAKEEKFTHS